MYYLADRCSFHSLGLSWKLLSNLRDIYVPPGTASFPTVPCALRWGRGGWVLIRVRYTLSVMVGTLFVLARACYHDSFRRTREQRSSLLR